MKIVIETDKLVTLDTASELLSVCRATVYNLMDSGQLKYVKLGKSRRVRMSALEELIERNTHTGEIARQESKPGKRG